MGRTSYRNGSDFFLRRNQSIVVVNDKKYIMEEIQICALYNAMMKQKRIHLERLQFMTEAIIQFSKGTSFEKIIPELMEEAKNRNYRRIVAHPLIKAYLEKVEKEVPGDCCVPLINEKAPNYIELATVTFLNSSDINKMFKIKTHKTGKGGYGKVYLGKHIDSGRSVAIKRLEHVTDIQKARNYKEVALLYSCNHPNIVKYYDCYQTENELVIVMEFLDAVSLMEYQELHKFDENEIAFIAHEILQALKYLKDKGLCHRDIKPGNIMLSTDYRIKLIDFGLCDSIHSLLEQSKIAGSSFWIAPETIFQAPHTFKADVWSLGCTLLELLDPQGFNLGCKVKTIFTVALEGRAKFIFQNVKVSEELHSFISAMLHRFPSRRSSVEDLLAHPFLTSREISHCSIKGAIDTLAATKSVLC